MLDVRGATKSYSVQNLKELLLLRAPRKIPALHDVSLEVRPGQVTALLGPNGAGKTTLVNIICDLTRADAGSVTVAGHPVPERSIEAQRCLGLVTTNDRSFFWRLTGRQNLEFFAALQGLPRRLARERSQRLLEQFGLGAPADRVFYTYSAGMKKRLGLARALLHDPALLLMDEPTNGLDAEAAEDLLTLVRREVGASAKAVLWATHRAEEVDRLCDRVVILTGGRVRFDGTIHEFREFSRRRAGFVLQLKGSDDQRERIRGLARAQGGQLGEPGPDGSFELIGIGDEGQQSCLLQAVLETGALVLALERTADPLHEVFKQLASSEKTAAVAGDAS
jgi:ABC-2 type transport system ATP-binding protein